ncbi:hypothetical protein HYG81_21405 (plasmid) [Natrinema zhouii]|uniref:hypothetical protein n=1 Tax=Natrinema zhouii TaxID=1710539 RepID=UPI001CFFF39B|nr:hypothetical protein [Natrinema zhouii]UHQ98137.1 hypothetical protein HYG81_21405 [Natrinema zhouii]
MVVQFYQRVLPTGGVISRRTINVNKYKEEDGNAQQQTHVTFDNPDHPDVDVAGDEAEDMQQWYRAAKTIQASNLDRRALVGDFLVAVNEDSLDEFYKKHSE